MTGGEGICGLLEDEGGDGDELDGDPADESVCNSGALVRGG